MQVIIRLITSAELNYVLSSTKYILIFACTTSSKLHYCESLPKDFADRHCIQRLH